MPIAQLLILQNTLICNMMDMVFLTCSFEHAFLT